MVKRSILYGRSTVNKVIQKCWTITYRWKVQPKTNTKVSVNIGSQINRFRDNAHFLIKFLYSKSRREDIPTFN